MQRAVTNVFGHLILRDEIIGISPLYRRTAPDQAMQVLYGACKLSFDVYTKQNVIKIESDYFRPLDIDQGKEEKRAFNKWKDDYNDLYDIIKNILLNEG